MSRPDLEVADVFRAHAAQFLQGTGGRVSSAKLRVLKDVEACRTAKLGGHVGECQSCGHRGPIDQAVAHLELIDEVLGGLFEKWDDNNDLLIITSDHGNIEEKDHRQHSRNPVPTILVGKNHSLLAEMIEDLTDIARVVRQFLGLPNK